MQPGAQPSPTEPLLKRSLSLPLLVFYGLGTILGAGIYVLIGEVAAVAGMLTPLSFVLASVMAAFTALSYAELSSRLPRSAGEAAYVQAAFSRVSLSRVVGLANIGVGTVSAATIANGFAGYLSVFVHTPAWVAIAVLVLVLTALAVWGIEESARIATAITVLEIGGLLLVVGYAGGALGELPARVGEFLPAAGATGGILAGALFAFYAFIGFEDMVVVAEEVRDPGRNLPRAIVISLVVSTALYLIVSLVCVLAVDPARLAATPAPLALVLESSGGSARLIAAISLLAVSNGALIQMIKSSRILYGISQEGWVSSWFGKVGVRTRTPVRATLLIGALVLLLSLVFRLGTLAQVTSYLTLGVFAVVNASLLVIKRAGAAPAGAREFPAFVPWCGLVTIAAFLAHHAIVSIP